MHLGTRLALRLRHACSNVSHRSLSSLADASEPKHRTAPLTPQDYRDGVMLAPMYRSSALPTRLMALKYGANLVWGPQVVDKAILRAKRVVDPESGTVQYMGQRAKALFTCHPLEKPYLIFQVGSASPALAVQAAKTVADDVAGVELNCDNPYPSSTHGGMGAALLSTPDLLCDILRALRAELPARISISAKIRLLETQEETKELITKIVGTGISCLTIYCHTRSMEKWQRARKGRMCELVEHVKALGKDVAVIQNGDCFTYEYSRKDRAITGADSCMIAKYAEMNPSAFSPTPLKSLEQTLIPHYLRLAKYLQNHWSATKYSVQRFKDNYHRGPSAKRVFEEMVRAKSYDDVESLIGSWTGADELREIENVILERERSGPRLCMPNMDKKAILMVPLENGNGSVTVERAPVWTEQPPPSLTPEGRPA